MARFIVLVLTLMGVAILTIRAQAAASQQAADCGPTAYAEVEQAGAPRLELELARTPDERSRGLMFRESLPENTGMLFVFESQHTGSFWNMNTLIPLSLAFIDQDGTIVDLKEMQPQTPGRQPDLTTPDAPYWYVIEANQGWFAAYGVAIGQHLTLCVPPAPSAAPAG